MKWSMGTHPKFDVAFVYIKKNRQLHKIDYLEILNGNRIKRQN